MGKNAIDDTKKDAAQESQDSVRRWWLSVSKWTLIGVFVVGLSTFAANLVGVFDYLDGEPDTPLLPVHGAPSVNAAGENTTYSRDDKQSVSSIPPQMRAARVNRPQTDRSELRANEPNEQAHPAPHAGDYSVIVSNSPNANTNATYNINEADMGPEQ